MPLADDNRTTSSLSKGNQDGDPNNPQIIPFETDEYFPIIGHRLTGGFTQSPINFSFDANESFEPIRDVTFVVNGKVENKKSLHLILLYS